MSKYMHGAKDTLHLPGAECTYLASSHAAVKQYNIITPLTACAACCITQQVRSSVSINLFEGDTESSDGVIIMFPGRQEIIVLSKTRT